ncbi:DUF3499 domain-containing protein [Corynebacterium striatum]|uniref:DUF3499 domain-containing protein n=1 Tax=Corynebacterium striatum TaxID=43770 RepID=A0ABC8CM57_CORST|nr:MULTISPECIES: DUF3499 domain-containing protein [Corynebacterium]ATZ05918.1 DUF3499 domain-containing protein [Corynebacterium striatum]ATZ09687.1 DUF3499 domain-containing protein [Corynebacterium striatum]EGT5575362.1 DUF3499 domain-containing protein [Corynebacterium striatum]EGT5591059.1 DUF3499 domain-containing protein [Corynebacterium striatum]EGT5593982.1 DUF3499 domain-containing protein [Corynebacterium striatum]
MNHSRHCSRPGCGRPAVATLTYAYSQQTAVVGPLAEETDPHSWDLCEKHSSRITAPIGWEMVRVDRIELDEEDDLMALAEAVREAGRVTTGLVDDGAGSGSDPIDYAANFDGADPDSSNHPVFRTRRVSEAKQHRRAHLTVVRDESEEAALSDVDRGNHHRVRED